MFRRLPNSLPKDFEYPADLEKLGYYINDHDQIRSIEHPDQEFNYFISKNERACDVQREAMNTCIRRSLHERFLASSLAITRLPLNTSPSDPHVPILTSTNLSSAKRIIIYFGEASQDLGIFAYRTIGQEGNATGSALEYVHAIQASKGSPGIVIANMGQLIWYRRGGRAVTQQTWNAVPRKTAVSGPMRIDEKKNRVPGNENTGTHIQSIFDAVGRLARKDALIDVIGVSNGAWKTVEYLQENWETWNNRIQAIAVGTSSVYPGYVLWHERFAEFWNKRARVYLISDEPVGTSLTGREDFGCNCYSSGSGVHEEVIMPRAHKHMLSFFQLVADVPGYYEFEQLEPKSDNIEAREVNWLPGNNEAAALGPSIVISKARQASD